MFLCKHSETCFQICGRFTTRGIFDNCFPKKVHASYSLGSYNVINKWWDTLQPALHCLASTTLIYALLERELYSQLWYIALLETPDHTFLDLFTRQKKYLETLYTAPWPSENQITNIISLNGMHREGWVLYITPRESKYGCTIFFGFHSHSDFPQFHIPTIFYTH